MAHRTPAPLSRALQTGLRQRLLACALAPNPLSCMGPAGAGPSRWLQKLSYTMGATSQPPQLDPALEAALQKRHVDVSRLLTLAPELRAFDPYRVAEVLDFLEAEGIDVAELLHKQPTVVSVPLARLKDVLALLHSLGVDTAKVVSGYPSVLSAAPESLQGVLAFLRGLGVDDIVRLLERYPGILGLHTGRAIEIWHYLQRLGLKPQRVLDGFPMVLGCKVEDIDTKVTFLRDEMGRNVVELESHPQFLGYDLRSHILPRHRYLHTYGRKVGDLGTFLVLSDEEFARVVAGTTFEDYTHWLGEIGSVP